MRRRLLTAVTTLALVAAGGVAAHAATDDTPGGGPVAPLVMSPHSPDGVPAGPVGPSYLLWTTASLYSMAHPGAQPQGVNDFHCTPRPGTHPVVLVAGTYSDAFTEFSSLAPRLKSEGLCVFAFNANPSTNPTTENQGQAGDIRATAKFMAGFVDRVLAATGADKVDVVGHSQGGGPLPRWYMKFEGGADKVNHLVGLAPSNRGTTYGGVAAMVQRDGSLMGRIVASYGAQHNSLALSQQLVGSSLLQALNDGGLTLPGVKYTVIATKVDAAVTPYTNTFLPEPGVVNTTVQDYCPMHLTDHPGMTYDKAVQQLTVNALLGTSTKVPC